MQKEPTNHDGLIEATSLGKLGILMLPYEGCPRGHIGRMCPEGNENKTTEDNTLLKELLYMDTFKDVDGNVWRPVLEEVLQESLLVREKGSGTRMLLEQAVAARGYSLDSFSRHSSISNFSIICDLVAMDHLITFAYEPISHCRNDLATFRVEDMEITGEFNLVYINRSVAEPKADLFLANC